MRDHGKTEGSADYTAVPIRLAMKIEGWKLICNDSNPEAFIFPASRGKSCMDPHNYENRILRPVQKKLGLPKLNFQILRRTFATLAFNEGKGNLKDLQKQMRHASPSTTIGKYVKAIDESVFEMVDVMHSRLEQVKELVN